MLQEIKTSSEKLPQYSIEVPDGYCQHWNCCETKKGYAGTAMLSKV